MWKVYQKSSSYITKVILCKHLWLRQSSFIYIYFLIKNISIEKFILIIFIYFYSKPICSQSFCNFRKTDPSPKWSIYKNVWDISKKCLCFGNSGILFVVCVLAPAYTSLCRDLEYHIIKAWYIIPVDPLRDGFLIFEQMGNTALCLKNRTSKMNGVW